ncbi:ASN_collapsed_G0028070.mRNA.1.CDS.1 [Saccharomyces cerevisiae]|nr:ASN_collapsed_G0028070.mRNA.1.CDS.1 [Saccharomyces cerevisiae]
MSLLFGIVKSIESELEFKAANNVLCRIFFVKLNSFLLSKSINSKSYPYTVISLCFSKSQGLLPEVQNRVGSLDSSLPALIPSLKDSFK